MLLFIYKSVTVDMGGNIMEVIKERYTITELSEYLQVTDHALRYYEKEFKLKIPKDERGRRYYPPEMANVMYQIKNMRNEGLEIKAIKKILESDNIISQPPPVVINEDCTSLIPENKVNTEVDLRRIFEEIREQLTNIVALETNSTKEHVSQEMAKTKLEISACIENSNRKLESKMDKHFADVDILISNWRKKSKGNFFTRIFRKSS